MKPLTEAWQSYAPSGRTDAIQKLLDGKNVQTDGPALPDKIEGSNTDIQQNVKALNDPTYAGMNQGEISLLKRSSNQPNVALPNERMHQNDQKRKLKLKQIKKIRPRVQKDAAEEDEVKQKRAKPVMKAVPPMETVDELPVESLEQHTERNNQHSLFTTHMADMNRVSTEVLVAHPPAHEVLAYANKVEGLKPAYVGMRNFVSASGGLYTYPDVPVLSRKAILPFLREAHPKRREERPCLNLDRNPFPHEGKTRCMSHIISAEKLGEENAFRCRELLIGDVNARINEAISQGVDPSIHLSPAPGYCFFCHLNTVLEDSIEQQHRLKNRAEVVKQEALFSGVSIPREEEEEEEEDVLIVNPFMIIIDKPGEYNRSVLLLSEKVQAGIWGPFILLNPDNYIATKKIPGSGGLRGFQERAEMHFFRLTRESSPRSEFQQRTSSTPSTHIGATFGNMNSLN